MSTIMVQRRGIFKAGPRRRPRPNRVSTAWTMVLAFAWLLPPTTWFWCCAVAATVNDTLFKAGGPPSFVHPAWMDGSGNVTSVGRVDVCALNACEAYVRMRDDLANAVRPINDKLRGDGGGDGLGGVAGDRGAQLEARLQRLDRRLRSVEQPGEYTYIIITYCIIYEYVIHFT